MYDVYVDGVKIKTCRSDVGVREIISNIVGGSKIEVCHSGSDKIVEGIVERIEAEIKNRNDLDTTYNIYFDDEMYNL